MLCDPRFHVPATGMTKFSGGAPQVSSAPHGDDEILIKKSF